MPEIRWYFRAGTKIWEAKCPECGEWIEINKSQVESKVTVQCTNCDWSGYV